MRRSIEKKGFSWSVSGYLLRAIAPYFVFSWLLLSVILFFQQASRYSDIFFSVSLPKRLVWELTFALIPSVIAFTCPMAILIGVIIGLSKMQGDSELIAVRAAGVGNLQITAPVAALGVLLSLFALLINLEGVPFAAGIVRKVAIQTALYKLESPIDPGVFNSELPGYTIYVREGDPERGEWERIFIYNADGRSGQARLITAASGRIDSSDEASELVLDDAVVTTLPVGPEAKSGAQYASENVGGIRFAIRTRRGEFVERLARTDDTPEALGLAELAAFAKRASGKEKVDAEILWERRVILSLTPFLFALLGTSLVLRFNRGGRGFGILLAFLSLVSYYLLTLMSEQLSRTYGISVYWTGLLPVAACLAATGWFFLSNRWFLGSGLLRRYVPRGMLAGQDRPRLSRRDSLIDLTTGLLDFDIIANLLRYFAMTGAFLASIYLIFTTFELWKFAGTTVGGVRLLAQYLVFLLPFIYVQLAPSALMIATLATFVIKSRQNEIVTWTSAGQSVYRLLLPCFGLMLAVGLFNLGLQETVLPKANQAQDRLRSQIRSRGATATSDGRSWSATANRIYSFDGDRPGALVREVRNLMVYEFSPDGGLEAVYSAPRALWDGEGVRLDGPAERVSLAGGRLTRESVPGQALAEPEHPFRSTSQRPAYLTTLETRAYLAETDSETERRMFEVALQKKYSTPVLPLLIVLFTAPFALSLSRKGKAVTIGYAVAFWLVFMGIGNAFEQAGLSGFLPAPAAVWTPQIFFAMVGVYLLSRIRT